MAEFVRLAALAEIPIEGGLEVVHDDRVIALFRDGDAVRALDGLCPHQGGPLAEGTVADGSVTCPWHDWQFDLCTGRTKHRSKFQAEVFEVRVEDDAVWVAVP